MKNINIGKKIKSIRRNKKIRQIDLAKLSGISNTYLSDIENNRILPSIKTAINISAALDINITNLFK